MQPNQTNNSTSRSLSRSRDLSLKRSPSGDYNYTRKPDSKRNSIKMHRVRERRYRSKSPSTTYRNRHSRSRSHSARGGRKSFERKRSESGSPSSSSRKRQVDTRENPQKSRCLGVFGLSIYTTEPQLNQIFSKYGPVERVQIVIDAKTGRSRGFCFIYYSSVEDATFAKDQCSGMEIDARRIRVDYSITQRAHTPTPGKYMGRPTRAHKDKEHDRNSRYRDRDDDYYERERPRYKERRSPQYHERKRRYDRSRSYSPRARRYH